MSQSTSYNYQRQMSSQAKNNVLYNFPNLLQKQNMSIIGNMNLLGNTSTINNLSNYSSCNVSSTNQMPKQFLQKTIQLKEQYINELMNQIKQTKSSYEQFKIKISEQNIRLKEQNMKLKQKIEFMNKEKESTKRYIMSLEQQKVNFSHTIRSVDEQSNNKIIELSKYINQLQENNKKLNKTVISYEKSINQLKKDKETLCNQIQNKQKSSQEQIKIVNQNREQAKKLKQNIKQLEKQNQILKQSIVINDEKKKDNKKYDKKLQRLQEKIVKIIHRI